MPAERILLSATAPLPEDWLAALLEVEPLGRLTLLPDLAALLSDASGSEVATVLRPRHVAVASEAPRLLGVEATGRPWWTEVVAPEDRPRIDAIVSRVASGCDGRVV